MYPPWNWNLVEHYPRYGSLRITKTTKVTGRGQRYFINYFLKGIAS